MKLVRRPDTTRRLLPWMLLGLLTGCATPPQGAPGAASWSGRLALRVDSVPPQSLSAGFELHGSPQAGELRLTSALGTTLAAVQWAPGGAELRQGDRVTRRATLDELAADLGGASLPVAALFAWLRGHIAEADGWQADLSRQSEGRVTARRTQPLPSAELRIIFQP